MSSATPGDRPTTSTARLSERDSEPSPVVVTFLAPADSCNQRCPACILDRAGEPVTERVLEPSDYARFIEELLADGVRIRGVGFQGYEVTLPRSWPYLERVFRIAKQNRIRRSFITNGMLLDRHIDSIKETNPQRISVSLDGSDPETNDRLRGLPGAFRTTTRSLSRALERLTESRSRFGVVSVLYDEDNFRSLRHMPTLLSRMGIRRWGLTVELEFSRGRGFPAQPTETLARWVSELRQAAADGGIEFLFTDEFGLFDDNGPELEGETLFDPDRIVRVEPTGHVRVGRDLLSSWRGGEERLWRPGVDGAADVIGVGTRTHANRDSA